MGVTLLNEGELSLVDELLFTNIAHILYTSEYVACVYVRYEQVARVNQVVASDLYACECYSLLYTSMSIKNTNTRFVPQ